MFIIVVALVSKFMDGTVASPSVFSAALRSHCNQPIMMFVPSSGSVFREGDAGGRAVYSA